MPAEPTLLMATRAGHTDGEAEPVLVERFGDTLVLTLDDGEELAFDARALGAAIE
jgi:hypothetical protein